MDYQIIILAGGEGIRLRPYTLEKPKPLLDVNGQTLIDITLKPLVELGITKFVIGASYKVDMIKEHFSEKYLNLDLSFIDEKNPAGKAGAIKLGIQQGLLDVDKPTILFHADDIIGVDIAKLIEHHKNSDSDATLVLSKTFTNPFGVVNLSDTKILSFSEKPQSSLPDGQGINCGMYIFSNLKMFEEVPIPSHTEDVVFPKMAKEGKLGYFFADSWYPINTKEQYYKLLKEMDRL